MTIGEDRKKTGLKTESFAFIHGYRFSATNRQSWRITALAFPIRVSSSLSCLPSLENVTPRYLNFSVCRRVTPFVWKEHWKRFLDMHVISVLAVLAFIPASKMRQKTDQMYIGDHFFLSLTMRGHLQTAGVEHYTPQM